MYVDGDKSPSYKLLWENSDLETRDLVSLGGARIEYLAYDDISGGYVSKFDTKVPYSDSYFKFTFEELMKEIYIYDTSVALNSVGYLRVSLYYFKYVVQVEPEYSAPMLVKLTKQSEKSEVIGFFDDNTDDSTFELIFGNDGSEDDGYIDRADIDEDDPSDFEPYDIIGALTTTFKMTRERLRSLGSFLWGAGFFDNIKLVVSSPMENIVSCKFIPYNITGVDKEIVLGNVDTGVYGDKVSNNFAEITIGTVDVTEYYKNFLDYNFTNVVIYLPYIGFKTLETKACMNKTLKVTYTIDIITGGCLAIIYIKQSGGTYVKMYEFAGNIGIDVSVTASNRAQVEAGYIAGGVSMVGSLATGIAGGTPSSIVGGVSRAVNTGIQSAMGGYHYDSSANPNPTCVAATNRNCYVIIDRPTYDEIKSFNHTHGRTCNLTKTIKNLEGFTICNPNIDLSNVPATAEEKAEITQILSTGFFA
jgi:hypothetical protein